MRGALEGIKVVEWGENVTAPFCTRVLADLGAEVTKVEAPGRGDPSRRYGPFPGHIPHPERSGLFLSLNANKLGITLDVEKPTGQEILLRLLAGADVFVENRPQALKQSLRLQYYQLEEHNPGLVVTSLTPYGRRGPYREHKGYDINLNAAGGISFGTGHPRREPLTTPLSQVSYMAGFAAALATLMALMARQVTGVGQQVEVAEALVPALLLNGYYLPTYIYKGIPGWRVGNRLRLGLFPNCVLPSKDGYICIDCPQMEQYQRFLDLIGNPDWVSNPRYRNRRAMTEQYPEEAEALIAPWFRERTKEEVFRLCLEQRIPCVPVKRIDEVVEDRHLNQRGYFQEVEHREAGTLKYPGPPYRFSRTPWRLRRAAPLLGEHNEEVYCRRLGLSREELVQLYRAGVI